jgi:hypothetical protein
MPSLIPRWTARLALFLILPAACFLFVVAIESLAGSRGSEGVFGSTFDGWRTQINVLLVVGPVAALGLVVTTSVRAYRKRAAQEQRQPATDSAEMENTSPVA